MSKTRHAATRMQQRGINPLIVQCLRDYGHPVYDHHGGIIYYFTKACIRDVERDWGREAVRRLVINYRNAYVVTAIDGAILTTGWRTARIKH